MKCIVVILANDSVNIMQKYSIMMIRNECPPRLITAVVFTLQSEVLVIIYLLQHQ